MQKLTSGGVPSFLVLLTTTGLEVTDLGELYTEMRVFCKGEGESAADLVAPPLLLTLLTRGVAGGALLLGVVSDKLLDLLE